MRRRTFITLLGGAAALPLTASAQQGDRVRRIGVLVPGSETDQNTQARFAAFRQRLQELGWTEGRNVRFDLRFQTGNIDHLRMHVTELLALMPDLILANGSTVIATLQQQTRTVPIVFVQVFDPVGGGFVSNLAKPGGNATGFVNFEYAIAGKWLALLREIASGVTRVAVIRDPTLGAGAGLLGAVQAIAPTVGVELTPAGVHDASEVEIADVTTEEAYAERDPLRVAAVELGGVRSHVTVPMLKENELIGPFSIYRQEVRPFTRLGRCQAELGRLRLAHRVAG